MFVKKRLMSYGQTRFPRPATALKTPTAWEQGEEGSGPEVPLYALTRCGAGYLAALSNPFGAPPGTCLPADVLALPSQKVRAAVRGTFSVQTNGTGAILVTPAVTNDNVCMKIGTVAAQTVANTMTQATVTNTEVDMATLPFLNADLGTGANNVAARVCGFGVRIWWMGDQNNCAGLCAVLEQQGHSTLAGYTLGEIVNDPNASASPIIPGEQYGVYWSGPKTSPELAFNTSDIQTPYIAIVILNAAASGIFGYEIVTHVEYTGGGAALPTSDLASPWDFQVPNFLANEQDGTNGPSRTQVRSEQTLHKASLRVRQTIPQVKAKADHRAKLRLSEALTKPRGAAGRIATWGQRKKG